MADAAAQQIRSAELAALLCEEKEERYIMQSALHVVLCMSGTVAKE